MFKIRWLYSKFTFLATLQELGLMTQDLHSYREQGAGAGVVFLQPESALLGAPWALSGCFSYVNCPCLWPIQRGSIWTCLGRRRQVGGRGGRGNRQKVESWPRVMILALVLWAFFFFATPRGMRNFPDQGWNLGPLQWKHGVLTTGPPGKSPCGLFSKPTPFFPLGRSRSSVKRRGFGFGTFQCRIPQSQGCRLWVFWGFVPPCKCELMCNTVDRFACFRTLATGSEQWVLCDSDWTFCDSDRTWTPALSPARHSIFWINYDAFPEILPQAISTHSWNIYTVNDLHNITTYWMVFKSLFTASNI